MKLIYSANGNGMCCKVDDADYQELNQYAWYISPGRYAHNWKPFGMDMHKVIASRIGLNGRIDHINRDKLDNQRHNLRVATRSQNAANNGPSSRNNLGYRGVSQERAGKWSVYLAIDGKSKFIGSFDTVEEAALAYDLTAKKVYGEFAFVNIHNPDPYILKKVSQQMINPKRYRGTSRFHGVSYSGRPNLTKPWVASLYLGGVDRRCKNLGYFCTEEEAAKAVDAALDKIGSSRKRNFSCV